MPWVATDDETRFRPLVFDSEFVVVILQIELFWIEFDGLDFFKDFVLLPLRPQGRRSKAVEITLTARLV